jgi:hypothetical protein
MNEPRKRHSQNAEGPFYVADGECIACGAPEIEADGLMSHDDTSSHCFFLRQPHSPDEIDSAIRATLASCCGAVRYGGNDPVILTRFAEFDAADQCDSQLSQPIELKHRTVARFKYLDSNESGSPSRAIIEYLANSMKGSDSEYKGLRYQRDTANFKYFWALRLKDPQYSILISIQRDGSDEWLLKITENGQAARWTAVHLDKILRQNPQFQSIRWFDSKETSSSSHPY